MWFRPRLVFIVFSLVLAVAVGGLSLVSLGASPVSLLRGSAAPARGEEKCVRKLPLPHRTNTFLGDPRRSVTSNEREKLAAKALEWRGHRDGHRYRYHWTSTAMTSPGVRLVEIAKLLGVTKQRAHQIAERPGFPSPLAEDAHGRVWSRWEVQRWAKKWRSARPWR